MSFKKLITISVIFSMFVLRTPIIAYAEDSEDVVQEEIVAENIADETQEQKDAKTRLKRKKIIQMKTMMKLILKQMVKQTLKMILKLNQNQKTLMTLKRKNLIKLRESPLSPLKDWSQLLL